MEPPKISVIIPCYNQGRYLQEAVDSVRAQTYRHWECIIVNDGSNDNTKEVALQLCSVDSRIRYVEKQNGGLSSARNRGLDNANGEYIQFLDADDRIEPTKFSSSLLKEVEGDIFMCNFYFFKSTGEQIRPSFKLKHENFNFSSILTAWDQEFVFPPHCGLFKSSLFTDLRFNQQLKAREDWLMWLQLYLKPGLKTVFIDQPLAAYRLSPCSMSKNRAVMDQSLVAAYQIIFPFVPENLKNIFFDKAIERVGALLADADIQLRKTRQSRSYRLGNFFIRNVKRFIK